MKIELRSTDSSQVAAALIRARRSAGSPTTGMVMTLIVVTDGRGYQRAAEAALAASREHPCRLLLVVSSTTRTSGLDAEIQLGEQVPGETVVLRMRGEVAEHPASVLLPLLLPDSPVVAWWPGDAPVSLAEDPIGALATRRITDADGTRDPIGTLESRAEHHSAGETDLAWARLTAWRALLAAAVDQYPATFTAATVEARRGHASAELMASWLEDRLGLDVVVKGTRGPGITGVRLTTAAGDIAITRDDGLLAEYAVPGQPKRLVALKRRDTEDLIAEELRRMDDDDVFDAAAKMLLTRARRSRAAGASAPPAPPGRRTTATKAASNKATAKKATAKKTTAKKTAAKKTAAKKTAAKKTTATKATAKKTSATAGTSRASSPATQGPGPAGSAAQEQPDSPPTTPTS